jgi:N-acetylglucosaminyldiphosphoundecaprenol N-acetyl-beta-D-mannosaminyltransferase
MGWIAPRGGSEYPSVPRLPPTPDLRAPMGGGSRKIATPGADLARRTKHPPMTVQALQVERAAGRRVDFLGCPLDLYTSAEVLEQVREAIDRRHRKCIIHFLNGNKVAQAHEDPEMREILWRGDFVLADGQPLLPMARLLHMRVPERIDGIGLMEQLLRLANQHHYRLFLLGAKAEVLASCVETIRLRYPDLVVAGIRDGYFQESELPEIVGQINAAKPDILLIGIGSPMKERLADRWGSRIEAPVIQGVGGSFDVMAGLVKRAPAWMQRVGLEWFYRVLQEPRRMFWRYLKTNAQCLALFAKAFLANSLGVGPRRS